MLQRSLSWFIFASVSHGATLPQEQDPGHWDEAMGPSVPRFLDSMDQAIFLYNT
jgi:hypothetical protein